jgi:hypothetical protein
MPAILSRSCQKTLILASHAKSETKPPPTGGPKIRAATPRRNRRKHPDFLTVERRSVSADELTLYEGIRRFAWLIAAVADVPIDADVTPRLQRGIEPTWVTRHVLDAAHG